MFVVCLILCLLILIITYITQYKNNYWKNKNIPYVKPLLIFGNYKKYLCLKKSVCEIDSEMCKEFPNEPFFGAFYGTEPTLIVQDLDYIRTILVKDFYYFNSREIANYTNKEVITTNIFFSYGDNWKIMRQSVTPLFSALKMKKMFYLVEECTTVLEKVIEKEITQPVTEVKQMMAGFTIDTIGSCIFGVSADALENNTNVFRRLGKTIFETSNFMTYKLIGRSMWPAIFYGLGFTVYTNELLNFFHVLLDKVFKQRQYIESGRNDFVDLLITLKRKKCLHGDSITDKNGESRKIVKEITDELLYAQCVAFFSAGFETSSSTLSHTLYELAKNPEAQEKAIAEVDDYFTKNERLTYECVQETPYLSACFNETMRLYPVLGVLTREVVEDYKLPSGEILDKGVRIHIPVYSIHRNPDYFPDPECYRPERFVGDGKDNIKRFSYMPFGEGPRQCLGMRFGIMQMTAGLMTVLRKCRLELAEGMPDKLEFEPRAVVVTQTKGGVYLKLIPRDNVV
ncbi:cytochrome P450 6B4-like isoform X1 [Leptidea sinapis]|uniref:cytochrome P450 6B4-like isoform X1 n=1 Tax=Leptidea sinapis TaxID=189913 RepID=UPI0021C29C55|nr:cytochrome P450 6B4-like isoform X1 [Leptidea sinapis]